MPIKLISIVGHDAHCDVARFHLASSRLNERSVSGSVSGTWVKGNRNGTPPNSLFSALGETLNFTKAAEVCHITQPALTRAIRNMEEELGGLLFSRERNNTHLTELGRLTEPHLAEIMARAGEAKQTAARFIKLEKARAVALGVKCTSPRCNLSAF